MQSKVDIGKRITVNRLGRRAFLKGALATAPLMMAGGSLARRAWASADTVDLAKRFGPSTDTEAYLLPSVDGVKLIPILTTGDSVGGYRMVGIPDGLGAFANGQRRFTLLMNHELEADKGIARAHGSQGAFVSRWTIDRRTLAVLKGEDFTQSPEDVHLWDPAAGQYVQGTTVWSRHCSGDLAAKGAYFHQGAGTLERIYLNGEEVTEGRAWARIATGRHAGEAWQLPRFGRLSYENAVALPHPQKKTVVVLTDDSSINTAPVASNFPSEVYVYVGQKTRHGHPIERAGLTNGSLFGLAVTVNGAEVPEESNAFGLGSSSFVGSGRIELKDLGDVSAMSGLELEQASIAAGVTRFQRPEDGAWDPRPNHRGDFYFVTTASSTNNCRLWRLRFDDVRNPEQGGTIEILLKGDEGHRMLDNVTIDRWGRILMDEDPGNSDRISRIWLYGIDSKAFVEVAAHNPKFFDPTIPSNPDFITRDEESTGLIDAADILGKGWFLLNVQAHKASADPELVEGGQLLAMYVPREIGA